MVTKFGLFWMSLISKYPAPHFKMWHVYCIIFSFKSLAETWRQKEKVNSTFRPLVFKTLNNLISTLFFHHISEHSSSPSFHILLWNDLAITSLLFFPPVLPNANALVFSISVSLSHLSLLKIYSTMKVLLTCHLHEIFADLTN